MNEKRGIDIFNRANHGNGNVSYELDLYSILRIPGAPSIILAGLAAILKGRTKLVMLCYF